MIEIDRMVLATDWLAVRDIYADGLATGLATLLSNPLSQNVKDRAHLPSGRILARAGCRTRLGGLHPCCRRLKGGQRR